VSQGTISVAPPSVSIPTAVITDNEIVGPSPLTLPSNTSGNTSTTCVSARNIAYDCNEQGQPLSVPLTTSIQTITSVDHNEGYDSDGEVGSFFDAVANEKDDEDPIFDEESIVLPQPEVETTTHLNDHVTAEVLTPTVTLTEVQVRQMTMNQLKDELSNRKLWCACYHH
jgi:hypothetical protein